MKRVIHYLNTDLDLVSEHSLEALGAAFASRGIPPLQLNRREDGHWYATLETEEPFREPEPNIVAFLAAIEGFDDRTRERWNACHSREFNIGYDCGGEPRAFHQQLTAPTLARMAALGISLRITLYPAGSATSA
jgi:hypothetical protein